MKKNSRRKSDRSKQLQCRHCDNALPNKAVACPRCEVAVLGKDGTPLKVHDGYSRFGVPRGIPNDVRASVRRECGFGCVVDGDMIVEYDHFDPPFVDLKDCHKASGIALLCTHCHKRKKGNRPELTNEMVKRYRAKPEALKTGTAHYPKFFFPPGPKFFRLGGLLMEGREFYMVANGQPLLIIRQPQQLDGPVEVEANIRLLSGATILRLTENVLIAKPEEDFEVNEVSSSLAFFNSNRCILQLDRSEADTMNILSLESWAGRHHIEIRNGCIYVDEVPKMGNMEDVEVHVTGRIFIDVVRMYSFLGESK